MPKNDMQERQDAFQAWKDQGGTYPPGVDRLVLDIAFKAGWEAHKNRRKKTYRGIEIQEPATTPSVPVDTIRGAVKTVMAKRLTGDA